MTKSSVLIDKELKVYRFELERSKRLLEEKQQDSNNNPKDIKKEERKINQFTNKVEKALLDLKIAQEREREVREKLEEAEAAKQQEKERGEILDSVAQSFLNEFDYSYSQEQKAFIRKTNGVYKLLDSGSMAFRHKAWRDPEIRELILEKLDEEGKLYDYITFSFREVPPNVLNLMDRSSWLTPYIPENLDEVEYHWAFDCLMQSLGGDKQENIEHIELVLAYKYVHPEDYKIPVLCPYGEGSIGKDLLVSKPLATIFGKHQVVSTTADNITGGFNSTIEGKTVVFVDEAIAEKQDMDKLKSMTHKPFLTFNRKNFPQYQGDNTPLWIMGGDSRQGAVRLAGNASDRRWSIIGARRGFTLGAAVARYLGVSIEEGTKWVVDHDDSVFANPVEVAKWLGGIMIKHSYALEGPRPNPLHGEDFKELAEAQLTFDQQFTKLIFTDYNFTCIDKDVLFIGYRHNCKNWGSGRSAFGSDNFHRKLQYELPRRFPDIEYVATVGRGNRSYYKKITDPYKDTRDDYLQPNPYLPDSNDKAVWIGPNLT